MRRTAEFNSGSRTVQTAMPASSPALQHTDHQVAASLGVERLPGTTVVCTISDAGVQVVLQGPPSVCLRLIDMVTMKVSCAAQFRPNQRLTVLHWCRCFNTASQTNLGQHSLFAIFTSVRKAAGHCIFPPLALECFSCRKKRPQVLPKLDVIQCCLHVGVALQCT